MSNLTADLRLLLNNAFVPLEIADPIIDRIESWERGCEVCEHGITVGRWCEDCNRDYKQAELDPENGIG